MKIRYLTNLSIVLSLCLTLTSCQKSAKLEVIESETSITETTIETTEVTTEETTVETIVVETTVESTVETTQIAETTSDYQQNYDTQQQTPEDAEFMIEDQTN